MYRTLSALLLATSASIAHADERNYTLRGDGWFDGGNPRFARLAMHEVRMTLHDNGAFAVTLFVRNERYLVRGTWDRRGRGNVTRIDLDQAFGTRASGTGTLVFVDDGRAPQRLVLEGRTGDNNFHAEIADDRRFDWNDPRDREDRGRFELGRGNRLYEDVELSGNGDGLLRLAGLRDGRIGSVRAMLRTNRDVRIEIERPMRVTIRGEIIDVNGPRVRVRVQEMPGGRASGELELVARSGDRLERMTGSGSAHDGSWQLDFYDRGGIFDRGNDRGNDRGDDGWGRAMESNTRGSGQMRQDVGPDLRFDRMRVRLESNRMAYITLESRERGRQSLELQGEWRGNGRDVTIDLTRVNTVQARGRLTLERFGNDVGRLDGDGRTNMGRFEVRFTSNR